MKRRGIKNLAIMVALVNLLSMANITDAKANSDVGRPFYILDKNGKVKVVDDFRIILNHGKTFVNGWEKISVFNEENIFNLSCFLQKRLYNNYIGAKSNFYFLIFNS